MCIIRKCLPIDSSLSSMGSCHLQIRIISFLSYFSLFPVAKSPTTLLTKSGVSEYNCPLTNTKDITFNASPFRIMLAADFRHINHTIMTHPFYF